MLSSIAVFFVSESSSISNCLNVLVNGCVYISELSFIAEKFEKRDLKNDYTFCDRRILLLITLRKNICEARSRNVADIVS